MFSVPGWNVSAPITAQAEKPKPKDPNKLGKKALKRKEKQEQQVNAENIGEYWDKVVDAKNGKDANPEQQPTETHDVAEAGDGAQEKRGRKRKRKSNKDKKPDGDIEPKAVDGSETATQDTVQPPAGDKQPSNPNTESKRTKKKPKKDTKPNDPTMFTDYHRGFAQQVEVWPANPVDSYVASILARGAARNRDAWKDKKRLAKKGGKPAMELSEGGGGDGERGVRLTGDSKPLPRNFKGQATIADLGCGTASLAYRLQPHLNSLHLTLHSFDLAKPTGPSAHLVTVADISALPLPDASVDVAIFCLALMGTNWLDFIDEANRILRWRGELWVAEIKSRFGRVGRKKGGNNVPVNSVGSLKKTMNKKGGKKGKKTTTEEEEEGIAGSDDEAELAQRVDGAEGSEGTDVSAFVDVMARRGFVLDALPERQSDAVDLGNKMFVKMQFVKSAPATRGKNAKKEAGEGRSNGERMRMGMKGKKFGVVGEDREGDEESEKKVLKPCLYKIR
ncbi:methyltransferase-domain-containing protein [Phaeosphaeriaceae sp. PMI808]|nr:methyltransferase-domain-containing protein [Phaeosphaeriaceae sp. PMI808]